MFTCQVLTELKYICSNLKILILQNLSNLQCLKGVFELEVKLWSSTKLSKCWKSPQLAGPRLLVKLLCGYQRWSRFWDVSLLLIALSLCWTSAAGREGDSSVSVWNSKFWLLLCPRCIPVQVSRRELSLCRYLWFAENSLQSLVYNFR